MERTDFLWECPEGEESLPLFRSKSGLLFGSCQIHGYRIYGPSPKKKEAPATAPVTTPGA